MWASKVYSLSRLAGNRTPGIGFRPISNLAVENDHVSLTSGGKNCKFTFQWLRDHCRDPTVYNHKTHQRSISLLRFPADITPQSVTAEGDDLNIKWTDGRESTFAGKWLEEQSTEDRRSTFRYRTERRTWDAATFPPASEMTTPFTDFMASQEGRRSVARSLVRNGFAMVSGVEPTTAATEEAVTRLAPVSKTIYGDMFVLKAVETMKEVSDSSYSNVALGAHTDTTYYNEAFGLQVFHCISPAEKGGENILVDGFNVAKIVRERHPDVYEFFSRFPVEAEYIHSDEWVDDHYYCVDRVFKHHPASGELDQFRFNVYDRAPHKMTLEEQREFYPKYRLLAEIVEDAGNEVRVKLEPGTVLFIDNWRVMHGRTGFQGERTMTGCYVNRSDFMSRAQVLGLLN